LVLLCETDATSNEIAERYERTSLRGGDILLGIIRATKVAIVPDALTGGNITQGTARFRPSKLVSTDYSAYWLQSQSAQSWLHSKYRGIDMPGLNLRDVRQLPVPIPPIKEQHLIAAKIKRSFAQADRIFAEATRAAMLVDRLDQGILAKGLRGELVRQDPTDEPANVLLERIKAERRTRPQQGKKQKSRA
jgi:type I restriction enzyme, S subunit